MTVAIHKIHWEKKWTNYETDIDFEVTVTDSMVTKVTHPCAKWAIGEWWHITSKWFEKKYAVVNLEETKEICEHCNDTGWIESSDRCICVRHWDRGGR